MKTLLAILLSATAAASAAEPPAPPAQKVFECTGEYTTGRKGAFHELVLVKDDTARIGDVVMPLKPDGNPEYFNYVVDLGGSGHVYQLTLFRQTGRFKYSTFTGRLLVAEGDCKRSETSKVFE